MRRHRIVFFVMALVVAALVAAACQPSAPKETGKVGEAPPAAGVPAPGKEGQPAPAAEMAPKQVMRIAMSSEPATIDPSLASFVGEVAQIELVFAPLMTFNTNLEAIPGVAEGYKASDDGLTYTFSLRKGTTFSDGVPVKAQHFEYAWKRLLDPTMASDYAFIGYVVKGAKEYNTADPKKLSKEELQKLRDALGVKATDDDTLVFTLKHPAPYFPSITALWFSVPLREELIQKGGDKWTEPETYIGNGPFTLKTWDHQSKMVYEANPKYYRGKPKLDRMEAVMISDAAVAFAAYRNNELDLYGVSSEDLRLIEREPLLKADLMRWPDTCTFYIGFNARKAPFDNLKVRQAFAQAVDREAYIRDVNKGIGKAAYSFIPPGLPGHQPDLKKWPFDSAGAKKALGDAGFAGGRGLPPINLTYAASARAKLRMEWVAAQFQQNLGVNVKLDPVEPKAYTELVKRPETTPQVFLLGWCTDYPDPQNWLSMVFHSESTIHRVGWKNPDYDRLTELADREKDPKKRAELYAQAQEILVTEAPVVFLMSTEHMLLKKPWVMDLKVSPMDPIPGLFEIDKTWIAKH